MQNRKVVLDSLSIEYMDGTSEYFDSDQVQAVQY